MREEEAPQTADAKKCEGLCIFSGLPAISFLHLCTQPLTPEMLWLPTQWLTVKLRGRLLQERFCRYSLLPRLLVLRTVLLCRWFLL